MQCVQGVADAVAIEFDEDERDAEVLGIAISPPCTTFEGNLDLFALTCTATAL